MARTMEATSSDEMQDGGPLKEAGFFHLQITAIFDGVFPDGEKPFDGISVKLTVIAGPHRGKPTSILFNDPKATHNDGGAFCKKKQMNLLIAANIITPEAIGQSFSYDEQKAVAAQVCAKMKMDEGADFPDLDYSSIYHVDDPRAKNCEKCPEALKLIPADYRRTEDFFKPLLGGASAKKAVDTSGLDDASLADASIDDI